ncbi:MAG: ABC transporter substrate-binding protein [Holosporales bacterium]|jgi:polar amino acid transport system substrate-binding protein|nr:ABC transporter substrate-binding protein [Holosporales bacterium]
MLRSLFAATLLFVCGCEDNKEQDIITFGVSADYPPFEYYENGKMVGFEIDLAESVASKLGKKYAFKDMAFPSLFADLQNGTVDVVVSAINPTDLRRQSYDFTRAYYTVGIALVQKKDASTYGISNIKVACQVGSVPEQWMKKNNPEAEIVAVDNVNQAVELIKTGHVDAVSLDATVAKQICDKNSDLVFIVLVEPSENEDFGFAMATKKESLLKNQIDTVIQQLEESGELSTIKSKWNLDGE